MILPTIVLKRLSEVRTPDQAILAWMVHANELEGYTFLLSGPEGSGAIRFPSRLDFPEGGHLRSVFAHDNIYILNHRVMHDIARDRSTDFRVDYSVAFDSNVASYLRAWHKGRPGPVVSALQSVFRALGAGRFNWDSSPFLMERSEAIFAGRDQGQIFETEVAAFSFAAADRDRFERTGEVHVETPVDELARLAQQSLAHWHRGLANGMLPMFQERYRIVHAYLLKMVLLQLERPSPEATPAKLAAFLEFMAEELHAISLLVLRAAMEFFVKGGAFRLMEKVANQSPRLRQSIRNVTWDFAHFDWRQRWTGNRGRQGSLFIPYFLTFDRGLADLYDLHPQRSCLFGDDLERPLFFADEDLLALLRHRHPELEMTLARWFNPDAFEERRRFHSAAAPLRLDSLVLDLERQLKDFEH